MVKGGVSRHYEYLRNIKGLCKNCVTTKRLDYTVMECVMRALCHNHGGAPNAK